MKIFKNAMISTLLLSSMAFGVAHGNNTDAIESNESSTKDTSPNTTQEQSNQNIEAQQSKETDSNSEQNSKTEERSTEPKSEENSSTEEQSSEEPTTEEPSTEEPSSNDSNHQDQVPPPNQSNSGKPSSEEPKTNEPNSNSNNDQNVNQYKPTMPAYPNTNEVGDGYYNNPQYTDEKAPKFIPGHSEAYYSKLDEDVLELVTSKVGSRPDLAQPKFKKTNKTAETTSVDDDDTKTETTKTTTESFETASDHKDISKPLIIGISIAIVLVLGFIILFIMRRFSKS